jgi:hypothetical protein
MAENIVLAQILSGIAALRLKKDIDTVIKEAKTRKCELVAEAARITLEENNALAKGNTEAMILANMEAFDYRFVAKKDLAMAKKWFNAPKVRKNQKDSVSVSAYYYWRIWNDASCPRYKGNAIMEKATGKSLLLHPPKIKTRYVSRIIGVFGTMPHVLATRETR